MNKLTEIQKLIKGIKQEEVNDLLELVIAFMPLSNKVYSVEELRHLVSTELALYLSYKQKQSYNRELN